MANPYEMRFNYYHAAKDYLQSDYQAQMDRILMAYLEESQEKHDLIRALVYPTREQIFALAEQIKDFSEKK
jgi:hypothetical protein